jgi:DNA repair protein RecO (recombination protein O)
MLVNTKAIVLTSLKFGESDLIVKCYTEVGIKSYLLKRIFKSKSNKINIAYFQPLTQLNITANHNTKGTLNSIREVRLSHTYQSIPIDIYKQAISLFLAETLSHVLQEEEKNENLFQFLETALIWFDNHEKTANFHLLFLLNLTKYLGFYPETKNIDAPYFNLLEGYFSKNKPFEDFVFGEKLLLFKSLIGINFDVIESLQLNSKNRTMVLEILLNYYELHLAGFKKPKSFTILKEVFQ